jgi:hypothetical protein
MKKPGLSLTDACLITAIWLLTILIVNPVAEFPLNDDWSFSLAAKKFYETGVFEPGGWTAMPLLTNVVWGSLFMLPSGFSFTALRFSTLVLSLAGVFVTYGALIHLGQRRWLAVVTACTLLLSPVYFSLSYTFMTDVHFSTLAALSSFFFILHLKQDTQWTYLLASILALAAMLSRQLAVFVPMAFAVAYMFRHGLNFRRVMFAALPSLVCILAYLLLKQWLERSGHLPVLFSNSNERFVASLLSLRLPFVMMDNLYIVVLYLGLFAAPLLIPAMLLQNVWRQKSRQLAGLAFFIVLIGLARAQFLEQPFLMPLGTNILNYAGLGPPTLHDGFATGNLQPQALPQSFWWTVTITAVLGAAGIVLLLWGLLTRVFASASSGCRSEESVITIFLIASIAIYLAPILVAGFFDRYLLPIYFPLLLLIFLSGFMNVEFRPFAIAALGVSILTMGWISIAGTRDYFSWNRARWSAVEYLQKSEGVDIANFDGGFEVNGLYAYDSAYKPIEGISWWWVKDDTYRIGFAAGSNYSVIKTFPYERWLHLSTEDLVVSRRKAVAGP